MKTTLLSLMVAMMIPAISSAKVEDFNAMITENAQSQSQLQNELRNQMGATRQAQNKASRKEIIDVAGAFGEGGVNSPTKKSLLTFKKETTYYRASEAKQMQRVANELKAADMAF